ncbi:MAG: energy-coupling factor ABC transporter ATP-binding protein [Desulfarculales bacterium]|jgi:cobalt/nickel transport system ATP-binding protein|nr:energy-coupling factor ABC transporter ATP-binding protein [Desulfarculales bacterium]
MSLIAVENLNFAYPGRPSLWRNLNFILAPGQRIGLWGSNGCGKSTLFNILMGLTVPQSGQIWLEGRLCVTPADFARQRTRLGYAFQDPDDQLFCSTVLEDVAFGPLNLGHSREEAGRLSSQALAVFGLGGFEKRITYHLSGGEKRLASLAAVWAMQPQALLLDEPHVSLDELGLKNLKEALRACGLPWLMASHDRAFLESTCNQIWEVGQGEINAVISCFT